MYTPHRVLKRIPAASKGRASFISPFCGSCVLVPKFVSFILKSSVKMKTNILV